MARKEQESLPTPDIYNLDTETTLMDPKSIQNQIDAQRFLTFTRELLRLKGDRDLSSTFMWVKQDFMVVGSWDREKSYSSRTWLKGSFSWQQFATNLDRGNTMNEMLLKRLNWGDYTPVVGVVADPKIWRSFRGDGTFQKEDELYYYFIYSVKSFGTAVSTEARVIKPEHIHLDSIPTDDTKQEFARVVKLRKELIKKAKKGA